MSSDIEIMFTLVIKDKGKIFAKKIKLDETGALAKDSRPCKIKKATGMVKIVHSLKQLVKFFKEGALNKALIHGIPKSHCDIKPDEKFSIIAKWLRSKGKKGLTRTADNFQYPDSDALAVFDYDPDESQPYYTPDELIDIISKVVPGFREAEKVINYSVSSHIYDKEGNNLSGETPGYHIYFLVKTGSDIQRFVKILEKRLWLAGYGYIKNSKSGSQLIRGVIDIAVFSPERLDFIAPPVLGPGLFQRKPDPIYIEGSVLDTSLIKDLTSQEEKEFTDLVNKAKSENKPQAAIIKNQYIETEADAFVEETKNSAKPLSKAEALDIVRSRANGELDLNDVLNFDTLGQVSVQDVLADPEKYDEESLSDPLEPEEGSNKAKFFANLDKGYPPKIHSFLHGGQTYTFSNKKSVTKVRNEIEAILKTNDGKISSEQWFEVIHNANLDKSDRNKMLKFLVDEKVGTKRELNGVYKQMAEDKDAQNRKQELEQQNTGREMIECDPSQLNQMVNRTEEALMKNSTWLYFRYGGRPCYTDDHLDQKGNSIQNTEIREFGRDSLALMIDQSVCFFKLSKSGMTPIGVPKEVLGAILDNPRSKVWSIKGMVCHPIILSDGTIVYTNGIDEKSGVLLHLRDQSFKPVADHPGLEDAQKAVKFLYETFFKEFCFIKTETDKQGGYQLLAVVSIAMLLTSVVRKVIDLAPGFLVNANIQGSGKTTLVRICHILLTGYDLPVSSLSGSPEEIQKQMLAMLIKSPPMVCFDNISDGAELRNQVISRIMTSPYYAGRVLGKSHEITVPTNTTVSFTGNNVSLAADLLRRFLIVTLSSDTDRPEATVYKNPDIVQHCRENRLDALQACLTIIKAFIAEGSPVDSAKIPSSGFPQWDQMVRLPLLWATGIDIWDSVSLSRTQSTEQQSIQGFIDALYDVYGRKEFTAKNLHYLMVNHENDQTRNYGYQDNGDTEILDQIYEDHDELITHAANLVPKNWKEYRSFVHILKKLKGRVVNGKKLMHKTNSSGNKGRYYIELTDPDLIEAEKKLLAAENYPKEQSDTKK